ncbi:MAG: hypothetical protein J5472_08875 [Clostridia bacterium]|nr:hypothetical protein [Clostridia bacterium]
MKKILVLLLLLALTVPAAAESVRLEGDGFDTPEEAALAFVDALNRADAGGMLSAFAMESFAAHADPILSLEHNNRFTYNSIYTIPYTDGFLRSLVTHARYGRIASDLLLCFGEYAVGMGMNTPAVSYPEVEALFVSSPLYDLKGHVEFVEWLSPAAVTGGIAADPRWGGDTVVEAAYSGAEDLAELAARLRINGNDAYLSLQCARYDGRWYLLGPGKAQQYMTKSSLEAFLILPDDQEKQKLENALAEDHAEETAQWDALRASDLGGSLWYLESLNAPGVALCGSPEDTKTDGGGAGVYAEMRLFSVGGGIITVWAAPALQQALSMDDPTAHIRFSWNPSGISTEYTVAKRGKTFTFPNFRAFHDEDIALDLTGLSIQMDETSVVFTLQDGTKAVFRRQ